MLNNTKNIYDEINKNINKRLKQKYNKEIVTCKKIWTTKLKNGTSNFWKVTSQISGTGKCNSLSIS